MDLIQEEENISDNSESSEDMFDLDAEPTKLPPTITEEEEKEEEGLFDHTEIGDLKF